MQTTDPLQALGLSDINPGTWSGGHGWSEQTSGAVIESINPATAKRLAQVRGATLADYEHVMAAAVAAAAAWRQVPAPKRGEAVRLMGDELRKYKDALGSLVSMENGKIKAEGDGEVQEMIDIADFAVGQSRMLYGLTMHSERPQHRMYEQWHPLGVVGVISAFNFPVAVWSWNAFLAAICGNATVWKPSPKTALCSLAVQHICNRVLERHALPPIFQIFIDAGTELAQRFVDGPPRGARVLYGLHPGGSADRRESRRAPRQEPAGARRQQRHHRRRNGESRSGGAGDRFRRRRNRGSALHHHAAGAGAPRARGRTRTAPARRVRPGAHRRPARTRHPDGTVDRCGRGGALFGGHRRGKSRGRSRCCAAARCCRGPAISWNRPSFAPTPPWPWCAPKHLRRFCT